MDVATAIGFGKRFARSEPPDDFLDCGLHGGSRNRKLRWSVDERFRLRRRHELDEGHR